MYSICYVNAGKNSIDKSLLWYLIVRKMTRLIQVSIGVLSMITAYE